MHVITRVFLLVPVVGLASCEGGRLGSANQVDPRPWWEQEGVAPPSHVDSLFPPGEALRRFREGLEEVTGFIGGTGSRADLVDRFVQAVTAADATALTSLAIDRAEFAWLYYPNSIYTAPPYDLPPEIVWVQHENYHSRGFRRLLERYGGETLYYTGHRCTVEEGEPFGPGRYWEECVLLGRLPTGEEVEERLFGGILEFDGRYKFLSYASDL